MENTSIVSAGPSTIPRGERLRLGYLYGGSARFRCGEVFGPRLLADFELVLLIEGGVIYEHGEDRHQLEPGSCVLARPGFSERYIWNKVEGVSRHAYFHFGIEQMPRKWPDPARWPVVRDASAGSMSALFRQVLERSHRRNEHPSASPPDLDCHLVELLIELFFEPPDSADSVLVTERPESVSRVIKWMRTILEGEPDRTVSLSILAEQAGVSGTHLCRIFKQSVGYPPMETFRLMQLQLAVALLVRSNLAVKEIAQHCGFADPLYFSRCFSATFGRSPRLVRDDFVKRRIAPPPNLLPVDITPRVHW